MHVLPVFAGSDKKRMTCTLTIGADGHMYHPYFIVKSAAKEVPCEAPDNLIGKGYYPEARYYATNEGWMTHASFHDYLRWIHQQLIVRGITKPVILVCTLYNFFTFNFTCFTCFTCLFMFPFYVPMFIYKVPPC